MEKVLFLEGAGSHLDRLLPKRLSCVCNISLSIWPLCKLLILLGLNLSCSASCGQNGVWATAC